MTGVEQGRWLGLDVGKKTVGIAISDPLRMTAQPLNVLRRTRTEEDIDCIRNVCQQQHVTRIVVGQPTRTDGSRGPEAEKVIRFAQKLEQALNIPVVLWDERFTTKIAQDALIQSGVRRDRRRQVIDKVAAALILQSYMDREDQPYER